MIFAAATDGVPEAYVFSLVDFTGSGLGAFASLAGAFASSTTEALSTTSAEDSKSAGLSAEVSIRHTTAPTATASPSSALSVIVPLSSAGSSSVALSESTSAIA